jgi:hypothetical protein
MPSPANFPGTPDERTALLLEAVDLLVDELALLAAQDWDKLPELKRKKAVTASKLRRLRTESEAADGAPLPALERLVDELETLSRWQIRARLALISNQLLALQDLSLYLCEAQHIHLRRPANRPLGNGGAVS